MKAAAIVLLFAAVLLFGCAQTKQNEFGAATGMQALRDTCKVLCDNAKPRPEFASGPCLTSTPLEGPGGGWVCDVVHNPRTASDNSLQNQCSAFLSGRAKHFIEFDLDCTEVREQ